MAKDICFYKKCEFRQWVGEGKRYCPFPRCFKDQLKKQEGANERTKQTVLPKT